MNMHILFELYNVIHVCIYVCCSNAVLLFYFVFAGPTILFFQENAGSILVVVDITTLGVRLRLLFHFIYLYLIRFNFFWRPWLLTFRYCPSPRNGSYNVAAVTMQCFHAFLQRVCIFLDTLSFWFFMHLNEIHMSPYDWVGSKASSFDFTVTEQVRALLLRRELLRMLRYAVWFISLCVIGL